MLKFNAKLKFLRIKKGKMTKTLQGRVERAMRQAGREFVRSAYPHIPVWTGMARASLYYLGRELRVPIPIYPTAGAKAIAYQASKGHSIAKGKARGSRKHITFSGGVFTFRFQTSVEHYAFNEFHNANLYGFRLRNPGPWNSLEHGRKAFMDEILRQKHRIIEDFDINDFVEWR